MTLNDKVKLWDAINDYVIACGGDPSKRTVSTKRMNAVVEVERVVDEIAKAASGGEKR